jgi:hypothetical protein
LCCCQPGKWPFAAAALSLTHRSLPQGGLRESKTRRPLDPHTRSCIGDTSMLCSQWKITHKSLSYKLKGLEWAKSALHRIRFTWLKQKHANVSVLALVTNDIHCSCRNRARRDTHNTTCIVQLYAIHAFCHYH